MTSMYMLQAYACWQDSVHMAWQGLPAGIVDALRTLVLLDILVELSFYM